MARAHTYVTLSSLVETFSFLFQKNYQKHTYIYTHLFIRRPGTVHVQSLVVCCIRILSFSPTRDFIRPAESNWKSCPAILSMHGPKDKKKVSIYVLPSFPRSRPVHCSSVVFVCVHAHRPASRDSEKLCSAPHVWPCITIFASRDSYGYACIICVSKRRFKLAIQCLCLCVSFLKTREASTLLYMH